MFSSVSHLQINSRQILIWCWMVWHHRYSSLLWAICSFTTGSSLKAYWAQTVICIVWSKLYSLQWSWKLMCFICEEIRGGISLKVTYIKDIRNAYKILTEQYLIAIIFISNYYVSTIMCKIDFCKLPGFLFM